MKFLYTVICWLGEVYYTITTVPAILTRPMDVTLEYSDNDLTAPFTCTAFGGDGAMLVFTWLTNSASGLNTSSLSETINPDNSITSTITTNPLTVDDSGKEYTCDVIYQGGSEVNDAKATLNIGEKIIENRIINYLLRSINYSSSNTEWTHEYDSRVQ